MMVNILQPIFMIPMMMMMDLLVIMHLLDTRHVVLLDLLEETLSLYDVVLEDETTNTSGSHVICRTRHRGGPKNNSLIREKEQISGILFF